MRLVLAAAALLIAGPALAFEPTGNPVADTFLGVLDATYDDVTVDAVSREGSVTVVTGVTATSAARSEALTLGTARITSGAVDGSSTLSADEITYSDLSLTTEGNNDAASGAASMTLDHPRLAADPTNGSWLRALIGDTGRFSIGDLVARSPNGQVVNVKSVDADFAQRGDPAYDGSIRFGGVAFDSTFLQGGLGDTLRSLGHDRIVLDMLVDGRMSGTGEVDLRDLTLAAADLGTLKLALGMNGVTDANVAAVQASAGDMQQLLQVMANVSFSGLTVTYTDAGLAREVIERTATQRQMTPEAIASETVSVVEQSMAILNNAEFTQQVSDALRSFLTAHGTLTVSAQPGTTLSLAQIFGGAMMQPAALPQMLNLSVTAKP